MSTNNSSTEKTPRLTNRKKPYKTPSVRSEIVFEVSALSCGKLVGTTQGDCGSVHKAS